jgi:peptidoglycan/LPS O-acetylase OafA/YrhL
MKPPRPPLFVARSTYRRRRLADAARMLPVLGMVLMVLPMLWAPGTDGARSTAVDGIYLFVIWGLLIGAAALLAPRLDTAPPDTRDEPEG